jgi:hypothetical protein
MRTLFLGATLASLALCQEQPKIIEDKIIRVNGPGMGPMAITQFLGDTIKGAPYSADSTTERVQVLADGNRITEKSTHFFARDAEGRTRTESTVKSFGRIGGSEEPVKFITITDPIAGLHYNLNTREKTAWKHKSVVRALPAKVRAAGATAQIQEEVMIERRIEGPAVTGSMVRMHWTTRDGNAASHNIKTEDLGSRTIEGVVANGRRTTITVPAGTEGNERPIEIVSEVWTSEELRATVLSRHTDPRHGTTETRLTNIRRADPARDLFEPPADYKLVEGGSEMMPAVRIRDER